MTDPKPTLDDAEYSRLVWNRFRAMLKWMGLASVATAAIALVWMHYYGGGLTIAVALTTAFGVALTVFMAAALMGLIFLSSGSGHDDVVDAQGHDDVVDAQGQDSLNHRE
ncbi:hypothetical protein [Parasphingopyxis sp.]|uniref:hypothetical protein n=1 Tax=Parasphingopyxis sp. TaxID=1920299 RepID=UPI002638BA82|nr:hypothetical protein [Parasphingopyxis sp.]